MRRAGLTWDGNPKVKPSFGAAEIAWAHPLATKLEFCVLHHEGGGAPGDLVSGTRGASLPTNWSWTTTPFGRAITNTTGSASPTIARPDAAYLGDISLVQWFRFDGNELNMAEKGNLGAQADVPFATSILATGIPFITRAGAGSPNYRRWDGADAFATGFGVLGITQVATITVAPVFYYNGNLQSGAPTNTGGGGTGTPTGTNLDIVLGPRFAGRTGALAEQLIYSRILSAHEMAWLKAEPFVMLRPRVARRYGVFAAPAQQFGAHHQVIARSRMREW